MARTKAADKTHCRNGHERTEENTYTTPASGKKNCLVCKRLRNQARRKKTPEQEQQHREADRLAKQQKRDEEKKARSTVQVPVDAPLPPEPGDRGEKTVWRPAGLPAKVPVNVEWWENRWRGQASTSDHRNTTMSRG